MSSTDKFFEEMLRSAESAAKRKVAKEVNHLRAQARSVPKLKLEIESLKKQVAQGRAKVVKEFKDKEEELKDRESYILDVHKEAMHLIKQIDALKERKIGSLVSHSHKYDYKTHSYRQQNNYNRERAKLNGRDKKP